MTEPQRRRRPRSASHLGMAVATDPEVAAARGEQRFSDAISLATPPGSPQDAEILPCLVAAPVLTMASVAYSSNAVFLVELDGDDPAALDGRLRAVYKPTRGERPLWDFPRNTLHLREAATYWLDSAIGYGLVPATVLRDGPHGPGSWQRFVHSRQRPLAAADVETLEARLLQLAALDVIANNADRKREHVLIDSGAGLWAIDNALTFLPYPRQRTFLIELGGAEMAESAVTPLRELLQDTARLGDLTRQLGLVLDSTEAAATLSRLQQLVADAVFPVLDPWDGRPFEWW